MFMNYKCNKKVLTILLGLIYSSSVKSHGAISYSHPVYQKRLIPYEYISTEESAVYGLEIYGIGEQSKLREFTIEDSSRIEISAGQEPFSLYYESASEASFECAYRILNLQKKINSLRYHGAFCNVNSNINDSTQFYYIIKSYNPLG